MNNQEILTGALFEDIKEVVIREGVAAEIQNPKPLRIIGNINAPSLFIEKRRDTACYDKDTSHAMVSVTNGTIKLVVNESYPDSNIEVKGVIKIGKLFTDLGINTEKQYSPLELANKLKLLRSYFKDRSEHMKVIASLRNLKAKVNQELNRDDDRKGNVKVDFNQTVQSNVPDDFQINLPLIEGDIASNISVSIILEANSSHDINCYLESIDAAELIDASRSNMVMNEVVKIENDTTVIFE